MTNTPAGLLLIGALSLISGCASMPREVPVAVSCPPPPPAPSVLMDKPASTGPSLSERFEIIEQQFEDSLTKAQR